MDLKTLLFILTAFAIVALILFSLGRVILLKRARAYGHTAVMPYLQAVPSSDTEKLDAADLALKGSVMIILGVLFPPLIFIGLVPSYYGYRKVALSLMGLGLTDSPIN